MTGSTPTPAPDSLGDILDDPRFIDEPQEAPADVTRPSMAPDDGKLQEVYPIVAPPNAVLGGRDHVDDDDVVLSDMWSGEPTLAHKHTKSLHANTRLGRPALANEVSLLTV